MASRIRLPVRWPGWRVTVPFLALAYPTTVLLYLGGEYCRPLCFAPSPAGVGKLVGSLLASLVVAVVVTAGVGASDGGDDRWFVRWLASPPRLTGVALLGVFAAFVGALTLDALSIHDAAWKPLALPVSFLLFLPVWVLYVASFPLAVLLSTAGIDASPAVTLAYRGVVVAVGFPLSVAFQALVVSVVVDEPPAGANDE